MCLKLTNVYSLMWCLPIICDLKIRTSCEFFGFIEAPNEESILIFHSCSSNIELNLAPGQSTFCIENHTGNTPRSIMTKGTSTRRKNRLPGYLYGNFDPGDQDKLMITYYRDPTHDYTMEGACGVIYQGDIHFFGGTAFKLHTGENGPFKLEDFAKQHFIIETHRSGKMVQMKKMKDLD